MERANCSLVPRLTPLACTCIACFYYLTFDLALVASEFKGQNYCKGGEPGNEAFGKWHDRKN